MATVVAVYEVDPYPCTAKSILGLEQPPERKRPRPEHKRTWARVEADQNRSINATTPDRRSLWPRARRFEMDGVPTPQRNRKTDPNSRIVGRPASFQKSRTQPQ